MKLEYYIMDKDRRLFYMGPTEYHPWICHAFTDNHRYAIGFLTAEDAAKMIAYFEQTKTEFDGNTPLAKGRLIVVRVEFVPQQV